MSDELPRRRTLESLRKEAKRWLDALRQGSAEARTRLRQVLPEAIATPTLRDVQHALAREQGFPGWMHVIAVVDPFTYSVHAFKSLLLKNTGFGAIAGDVAYLLVFSVIAMTAAPLLFKRPL